MTITQRSGGRIRQSDVELLDSCLTLLAECGRRLPDFRKKVEEWKRGGLPSSSVPEAISGTSDPVLPTFDAVDNRLSYDTQWIHQMLHGKDGAQGLWHQALAFDRLLNRWLLIAPPAPDAVVCENLACANDLEAGRTKGECGRCRVWRVRHAGMEYPKEPKT